jgi:hypothetical protein
MESLIEALNIFLKYRNEFYPISCEYDTFYINGIDPEEVSEEDKTRLEELGFLIDENENVFFYFT